MEQTLPFVLLGLDFDNGGEWLNWHLIRYRPLKMEVLSAEKKRRLKAQYESLDPFELHERLDKSLRPILAQALEAN